MHTSHRAIRFRARTNIAHALDTSQGPVPPPPRAGLLPNPKVPILAHKTGDAASSPLQLSKFAFKLYIVSCTNNHPI